MLTSLDPPLISTFCMVVVAVVVVVANDLTALAVVVVVVVAVTRFLIGLPPVAGRLMGAKLVRVVVVVVFFAAATAVAVDVVVVEDEVVARLAASTGAAVDLTSGRADGLCAQHKKSNILFYLNTIRVQAGIFLKFYLKTGQLLVFI